MPKSRTRKPKTSNRSRTQRSSRHSPSGGFRVNLPHGVPDEVLRQIMPLPPSLTIDDGQLTHSPAVTYVNARRDGADQDALEFIARWPFRMGSPDGLSNHWLCLAMLAHQKGMSVEEAARVSVDLEDWGYLTWDTEQNAYMMTLPDTVPPSSETAEQRALRRWGGAAPRVG